MSYDAVPASDRRDFYDFSDLVDCMNTYVIHHFSRSLGRFSKNPYFWQWSSTYRESGLQSSTRVYDQKSTWHRINGFFSNDAHAHNNEVETARVWKAR